jgi:hypothetical protein
MGKNGPFIALAITGVIIGVMLLLTVATAAAFFGLGGGSTTSDSGTSGSASLTGCDTSSSFFDGLPAPTMGDGKVPKEFIPFYEDSAAKAKLGDCGAAILAATHNIECHSGGDGSCADAHNGGVLGPMQFQQATWNGEIGNSETKAACAASSSDILKVEKAICVAAFHDKHNGAPKDWRGAIFAYNHADWYVDGVLALAKKIAGGSS